jgi:hypothetical protein
MIMLNDEVVCRMKDMIRVNLNVLLNEKYESIKKILSI